MQSMGVAAVPADAAEVRGSRLCTSHVAGTARASEAQIEGGAMPHADDP